MIPLLNILLLSNFHSIKKISPVRTYISKNIQGNAQFYVIGNDLDELMCSDYKPESFIDFLAYLIRIDVEFIVSGDYFIFRKKTNE